jgi:RNA polymerase sigma-70 factor (ECF subfamily)
MCPFHKQYAAGDQIKLNFFKKSSERLTIAPLVSGDLCNSSFFCNVRSGSPIIFMTLPLEDVGHSMPKSVSEPTITAEAPHLMLFAHHREAFVLAYRLLGNAADAEDAVQEAYLRAFKYRHSIPAGAEGRLWFLKVTANAALHEREKCVRRKTHEEAAAVHETRSPSFACDESDAIKAVVENSIASLREEWRSALSLHYELGLPYSEAAAILGAPEGTVRSNASRALETIRERLTAHGFAVAPVVIAGFLSGGSGVPTAAVLATTAKTILATGIAPAKAAAGKVTAGISAATKLGLCAAVIVVAACTLMSKNWTQPPAYAHATLRAAPLQETKADDGTHPTRTDDGTPRGEPLIEKKIDADFAQDYPGEVLSSLHGRYGLNSAYPSFLAQHGTLTLKEKGITIKALLEKLAQATGLIVEFRENRVFVSEKIDDKTLHELTDKLKSPDRWVRAEAAWLLAHTADPRVYPLLFNAASDADLGVAHWIVLGLSEHLDVLPYINDPAKEQLIEAGKRLGARPQFGTFDNAVYFRVLGAVNTPKSLEYLLERFKSNDLEARADAAVGLGYSTDPKALDALVIALDEQTHDTKADTGPKNIAQADSVEYGRIRGRDRLRKLLIAAIGRSDDSRAVDALVRWAGSKNAHEFNYALQAVGTFGVYAALSRMPIAKAEDVVIKFIHGDMGYSEDISPWNPRIGDALADKHELYPAMLLANARDERAFEVLDTTNRAMIKDSYGQGVGGYSPRPQLEKLRGPNIAKTLTEYDELLKNRPAFVRIDGNPALIARDQKAIAARLTIVRDEQAQTDNRLDAARELLRNVPDRRVYIAVAETLRSIDLPLGMYDTIAARYDDGRLTPGLERLMLSPDAAVHPVVAALALQANCPSSLSILKTLVEQFPGDAATLERIRKGIVYFGNDPQHYIPAPLPDPEYNKLLQYLAQTGEPFERLNALFALNRIHDSSVVEPLLQLLKDDPRMASLVVRELAYCDNPRAAQAVAAYVLDPNNQDRETFFGAAARMNDPAGREALKKIATDPDVPIKSRAHALLALPELTPELLEHAFALLKDINTPMQDRVSIIGTLLAGKNDVITARLLDFLTDPGAPAAQAEQLLSNGVSLAALDEPSKKRVLDWMKKPGLSGDLRVSIIQSLTRRYPDPLPIPPDVVDILLELHNSGGVTERPDQVLNPRGVLQGLMAQSKDPRALKLLVNDLKNPDAEMARMAMFTLASVKALEAIDPLLVELRGEDFNKQDVVAWHLSNYLKSETLPEERRKIITVALADYQEAVTARPKRNPDGTYPNHAPKPPSADF